jgi:hypothetical protein
MSQKDPWMTWLCSLKVLYARYARSEDVAVIDKLEQTTAVYGYQKEQMEWVTINPVWITGGRSELIFRLPRACSPEENGGLFMKLPS